MKGSLMIQLTPRLAAAASLVPPAVSMADIGTDHAYLPIFLIQSGKIKHAIASDIHEGPAERAKEHIGKNGLTAAVHVRIAPGLLGLMPGEAEGAVIAGMGGLMIRNILEEGADIAETMQWFVLQPQNHGRELRLWLAGHGYAIEKECLAREDRMIYQLLFVRHGEMAPLTGVQWETGNPRLREKDPLFPSFLEGLIRKRDFTIQGVAKDTDNPVNKEKRRRAVEEKQELEELLWKLKPGI